MKKAWYNKWIQGKGNISFSKNIRLIILPIVMLFMSVQSLCGQSATITPTFDLGSQLTVSARLAIRKDISSFLQVSDLDRGQLLTWSIVSAAGRGTLYGFPAFSHSGNSGILPDKLISYEPLPGQSGNDSFVIQISDGSKTSHLFVTINIVPTEATLTDSIDNAALLKLQVNKRNIAIVQPSTELSVPFGTRYSELKQPTEVQVIYANQEEELLPTTWYESNFDGNVAGSYLLIGDLLLTPGSTNTNYLKGQLTVIVRPNSIPSALLISDYNLTIAGDQSDLGGQTLTNLFTTEDADDSVHTYQLVEGPGDSDNCTFGVRGGVLTLKSPEDIKGQTNFSIRVKSTDASHNSIEKVFNLSISTAANETLSSLEVPNTFSPNGDGINDVWIVTELEHQAKVDIQVYDRLGFSMFHSTDPLQGWDGRNPSGKIVAGIYFYIIKAGDPSVTKQGVLIILTN